jgi:hypothetical protein
MLGMLVQRECVIGRGMNLHPSFIHSAEQDTSGRRNVQAFIDAMCIEKSKTCRQIAMRDLNACRL